MGEQNNKLNDKMTNFFRKAFAFYGKEICLESHQHFGIEQIVDEEKEQQGEYNYHIQYGFPSSGCVSMNVSYSTENNSFLIDKMTVYAPPADKELVTAIFTPQSQIGEVSVSANFGLDIGTEEHKSKDEIINNPNALKMLDIAINDLSKAEILGECRLAVSIESDRIPLCNATNRQLSKGKR